MKNEIIAIFYTVRQKTTTSAQGKRILLGKNEFDLFVKLRVLLRAIKNNGQYIKIKKGSAATLPFRRRTSCFAE